MSTALGALALIVVAAQPVEAPLRALKREEILETINSGVADVRLCWEAGLEKKRLPDGRVTFRWTVAPSGEVERLEKLSDSVGGDVAACVAKVLNALEFPPPRGGERVHVTYPFVFSVNDEKEQPKVLQEWKSTVSEFRGPRLQNPIPDFDRHSSGGCSRLRASTHLSKPMAKKIRPRVHACYKTWVASKAADNKTRFVTIAWTTSDAGAVFGVQVVQDQFARPNAKRPSSVAKCVRDALSSTTFEASPANRVCQR